MAINKKLIHFKNFSDFNSKKLSANENNTQYTLGVGGEVQQGLPDILYQSICWIKDAKKIWTHGQYYDCNGGSSIDLSEYLTANEIAEIYATTESLNEKQDTLVSGANIKTINGESILGGGTINVAQCTSTGEYVIARGIFNNYDVVEINADGITFIPEGSSDNIPGAPQQWSIHRDGDGTKFLSDDGTYKEACGGNSNANIQAVDCEDYQEPESRPVRDAIDLTTGEKIYFTGDARYICVNGNSMLLDYIDDQVNLSRIIKYDIEAGNDVPISDDLGNWIFSQDGMLILNGGVAILVYNEEGNISYIQSSVVKDNTIFVTKVFLTLFGYDSDLVTIDNYPISEGSGGTIDTSNYYTKTEIDGKGYVTSTQLEVKQDMLVSGINIKTINGETVLGSGDMTISPQTPIHYKAPSISVTTVTIPMNADTVTTTVSNAQMTFVIVVDDSATTQFPQLSTEQKWNLIFNVSPKLTSAPAITFISRFNILWANGEVPTFEPGKHYEVSFLNVGGTLLGVCGTFSAAS